MAKRLIRTLTNCILLPALTLSCNLMMIEMWQSYRCNARYNCHRCPNLFPNFLMDFRESHETLVLHIMSSRAVEHRRRRYCRRPPMHYLWRLQCRAEAQALRARKFKTILHIFFSTGFWKRMIIRRRSWVVEVDLNFWPLFRTRGDRG